MTREEAKSCIGTIEMLQRLAYNIHGVMDVIDADNCKKIIKALEQEPTIEEEYEYIYIGNGAYEKRPKVKSELTTKNDLGVEHHKQNIQAYAHDFGVSEEQAEKELRVTIKNDLADDCISRKAVIDELKRYFHDEYYQRTSIQDCRDCFIEDVLNHLPSVTPQPRKGHWIGHGEHCRNLGVMPSGLGAYEWCSNCDCGIDVREWYRNNYNYCPNCGCRMVEPQESEGKE